MHVLLLTGLHISSAFTIVVVYFVNSLVINWRHMLSLILFVAVLADVLLFDAMLYDTVPFVNSLITRSVLFLSIVASFRCGLASDTSGIFYGVLCIIDTTGMPAIDVFARLYINGVVAHSLIRVLAIFRVLFVNGLFFINAIIIATVVVLFSSGVDVLLPIGMHITIITSIAVF